MGSPTPRLPPDQFTYVNAAEAAHAKASTPKERIALQVALKFNGGGEQDTSITLFWKNLALVANGPLKKAIVKHFGSFDNFKEFNTTTAGIQGSGWGWLMHPLLTHVPIIAIDIWEYVFYLQYLNVKADYLNAVWNVINFDEAVKCFLDAGGNAKH
ncbi:Manganese/iron superoxide dismutase [Cyathus striatus]|nr:Manganese/iron superoxide dismutase [Cyathus striatus]